MTTQTLEHRSETVVRPRITRWMRGVELTEAMGEADAQATNFDCLEKQELQVRVKQQLREPIEYIGNEAFENDDIAVEIFSDPLRLQPRQSELGLATIRRAGVDLPIHLSRLCVIRHPSISAC